MTREDAQLVRALALRALVHRVDDGGQAQRLDVETHEGVVRAGVEVLQPFGVYSVPAPGGLTVVLAMGGDPSDLVALPVASAAARFGNLQPGEVAVCDDAGNRVHIKAGGLIEIVAAAQVRIVAPETRVEGNLVVTGQVSDAAGSMQEMRDRYNIHRHGGGPTPSPAMD